MNEEAPKQKQQSSAREEQDKDWETRARALEEKILNEATLIRAGARYTPNAQGDLVLTLSQKQAEEEKEEQAAQSPESQKLGQQFNKLAQRAEFAPLFKEDSDYSFEPGERTVRQLAGATPLYSGYYFNGLYSFVSLHQGNSFQRPYIELHRKVFDGGVRAMQNPIEHGSIRYYSIEEFVKNLRPEEKERGEALCNEIQNQSEE